MLSLHCTTVLCTCVIICFILCGDAQLMAAHHPAALHGNTAPGAEAAFPHPFGYSLDSDIYCTYQIAISFTDWVSTGGTGLQNCRSSCGLPDILNRFAVCKRICNEHVAFSRKDPPQVIKHALIQFCAGECRGGTWCGGHRLGLPLLVLRSWRSC
jgi:hypothetical protein